MNDNIAQAVAAARAAIGTPFHHQGREVGVGLDCIGLVIIALRAVGLSVHDRTDYLPRPDGNSLQQALLDHGCNAVPEIVAGSILLFRYDNQPQHVALATSAHSMIHAFAPACAVVETEIGDYWRRRLVGIYAVLTTTEYEA